MALSSQDIKNGIVYKLTCPDGMFYIGSTYNTLSKRLSMHKQKAKQYPDRKLYKHIDYFGWDEIKMECIETIPFTERKELYEKENEHLKKEYNNPKCLNSQNVYTTPEEMAEYFRAYADRHKEKIRKYKKEYAEIHKEEIKEKSKAYRKEKKEYIQEKGKRYYKENKEFIREKQKKYNEKNKEKLLLKYKEYREKKRDILYEAFTCECGGHYTQQHKKRHEASKKHQKFIEQSTPKN